MKLIKNNKVLAFTLALLMSVLPLSNVFAQDSGSTGEYDEFGEKVMQETKGLPPSSYIYPKFNDDGTKDITDLIVNNKLDELKPYYRNNILAYKDNNNRWIAVDNQDKVPDTAEEFNYFKSNQCPDYCYLEIGYDDSFEISRDHANGFKNKFSQGYEFIDYSEFSALDYDNKLNRDLEVNSILPVAEFGVDFLDIDERDHDKDFDKDIYGPQLGKKISLKAELAVGDSYKMIVDDGTVFSLSDYYDNDVLHKSSSTVFKDITINNIGYHITYPRSLTHNDDLTMLDDDLQSTGKYFNIVKDETTSDKTRNIIYDLENTQVSKNAPLTLGFSHALNDYAMIDEPVGERSSITYGVKNRNYIRIQSKNRVGVSNYKTTEDVGFARIHFKQKGFKYIKDPVTCEGVVFSYENIKFQKLINSADVNSSIVKLGNKKPQTTEENFKFLLMSYTQRYNNFGTRESYNEKNIGREGTINSNKDTQFELAASSDTDKIYFLIETDSGDYKSLGRILPFYVSKKNGKDDLSVNQINGIDKFLDGDIFEYIKDVVQGVDSGKYQLGEAIPANEALVEFYNGGVVLPDKPSEPEDYPLPMTGKYDGIINVAISLSIVSLAVLLMKKKRNNDTLF